MAAALKFSRTRVSPSSTICWASATISSAARVPWESLNEDEATNPERYNFFANFLALVYTHGRYK